MLNYSVAELRIKKRQTLFYIVRMKFILYIDVSASTPVLTFDSKRKSLRPLPHKEFR